MQENHAFRSKDGNMHVDVLCMRKVTSPTCMAFETLFVNRSYIIRTVLQNLRASTERNKTKSKIANAGIGLLVTRIST